MPGMRQDLVIVSGNASVDVVPDVVSFDADVHVEGQKIRGTITRPASPAPCTRSSV